MKIGVLVDRITPGATPKFLAGEVSQFRAMGHDAEAIAIVDTGLASDSYQFNEFLDTIPIRYMSTEHPMLNKFDFGIPPFAFFSAFDLVAGYSMGRFLRNDAQKYDLIVAHTSISSWIANKIKRSIGIPYISVMWDTISFILEDVYQNKRVLKPLMPIGSRLARAMDRRLIDEALFTITGSLPHQKLIEQYTGRSADVVYPGVEAAEDIPEQRGDYFFTIDRWDQGNLPTWLLDVIVALPEPIMFKIAGFWWPSSLRTEFEKIIQDKGLSQQVELLGPVSEAELTTLFRGARAMIYPHNAGIVFGVMEAAAQGCPVMMQESIDLFSHGVNGLFPSAGSGSKSSNSKWDTHRPDDLTEFVEHASRLATDERFAWQLGHAAWELIKDYSWQAHAEKIIALTESYWEDQNKAK